MIGPVHLQGLSATASFQDWAFAARPYLPFERDLLRRTIMDH